jgi:septum formation protein
VKSIADLQVILASSSPRRRQLLDLIGIAHEVQPADIDETYLAGEIPEAHAERLAREKAETIAAHNHELVIIAADTIVVIDGMVLGKPRDVADAERMLAMLSGRTHTVMTAVAVAHESRTVSYVEIVDVTFMPLDSDDIRRYVATGEPMDKAGAYGIQGYGATIVRRIDGDYFAVMGLSLVRLVGLLREVGVSYDFPR